MCINDNNCMRILCGIVDIGEASTLTLGIEIKNSLMILDDLKARRLAKRLQLNYTGTLGTLVKARQQGILQSLSDALNKLKNQGFRLSKDLEEELLMFD